jgi:hypothetical protein
MSDNFHILYRINATDEIVFANDDWSRFAVANDAPELVAEKILNRSLWDFITDATTEEVYRKLIKKARDGNVCNFKFRCDAPDFRRLLEMTITLRERKSVEIETRVIQSEKRPRQNILRKDARLRDSVLTVCSWCAKIDTGAGNWQEIEEAIENLGLFELENLPQLSHGMCASCYRIITTATEFSAKHSADLAV